MEKLKEKKENEMLDRFIDLYIDYTINFMERAYKKITKTEAKNLFCNSALHLMEKEKDIIRNSFNK